VKKVILVVAHGTVEHEDDIPAFLDEIRMGRAAPDELVEDLKNRYRIVGGSPLLKDTRALAERIQEELKLEARVAMRLWEPRVRDVVKDLGPDDLVVLVPIAPFSVAVYEDAARKELTQLASPPRLKCIEPWGEVPALIEAHAEQILEALKETPAETTHLILSAHSLPQFIVDRGDRYSHEFERCAALVGEKVMQSRNQLGLKAPSIHVAYQSQGASGGAWLGPDLSETFENVKTLNGTHVVVAPIGFLSEHIETLYDLDIESKQQVQALGMHLIRVPTLGCHSGLVRTLSHAVRTLLDEGATVASQTLTGGKGDLSSLRD